MSGQQTPSTGRIVHYVSHGTPIRQDGSQAYTSECRAAIITEVDPAPRGGTVGLCVLNPTGQFFTRAVEFDPGHEVSDPPMALPVLCTGRHHPGGTWHWPERVG